MNRDHSRVLFFQSLKGQRNRCSTGLLGDFLMLCIGAQVLQWHGSRKTKFCFQHEHPMCIRTCYSSAREPQSIFGLHTPSYGCLGSSQDSGRRGHKPCGVSLTGSFCLGKGKDPHDLVSMSRRLVRNSHSQVRSLLVAPKEGAGSHLLWG